MGPNIQQVSDLAGVSRVTVSRALNGDFRVKPQTVEKVLIAAQEIGYKLPPIERRSQRVAQGTVHKSILKTGQLAFLIPDPSEAALSRPMSQALQFGINEVLFGRKIGLVPTSLGPNFELPICLQKKMVDGFIIRGDIHDYGIPAKIQERLMRFPHVTTMHMNYRTPEDQIVPDEGALGEIVAQEFAARNCQNIIMLRPEDNRADFAMRAASFNFSAKNMGLKVKEYVYKDFSSGNLPEISETEEKPDGVFAFHHIKSAGTILKEKGWTPEQGVQVCSDLRDISELKKFLPTGSFGVDLRIKQIGAAAAEQLLWRIQHPQAERRTISIRPEIVKN